MHWKNLSENSSWEKAHFLSKKTGAVCNRWERPTASSGCSSMVTRSTRLLELFQPKAVTSIEEFGINTFVNTVLRFNRDIHNFESKKNIYEILMLICFVRNMWNIWKNVKLPIFRAKTIIWAQKRTFLWSLLRPSRPFPFLFPKKKSHLLN